MKVVGRVHVDDAWFSGRGMHAIEYWKNLCVHAIRLHFCSQDAEAVMELTDNDGEKAMLFAVQAIQAGSCAVVDARKIFITRITDAGFTRRAELSSMLCHLPSTNNNFGSEHTLLQSLRRFVRIGCRHESDDAI